MIYFGVLALFFNQNQNQNSSELFCFVNQQSINLIGLCALLFTYLVKGLWSSFSKNLLHSLKNNIFSLLAKVTFLLAQIHTVPHVSRCRTQKKNGFDYVFYMQETIIGFSQSLREISIFNSTLYQRLISIFAISSLRSR